MITRQLKDALKELQIARDQLSSGRAFGSMMSSSTTAVSNPGSRKSVILLAPTSSIDAAPMKAAAALSSTSSETASVDAPQGESILDVAVRSSGLGRLPDGMRAQRNVLIGNLQKQGGLRKNWLWRRFTCDVESRLIIYYADDGDERGRIVIGDVSKVSPVVDRDGWSIFEVRLCFDLTALFQATAHLMRTDIDSAAHICSSLTGEFASSGLGRYNCAHCWHFAAFVGGV